MSPSFYPSSIGFFSSTSVSTSSPEPEPYVYPDHSDLYPVAERLGMQHHMSLTWASWFPDGRPVPERPDYMAAYDLMELHGLPVESDLLACFIVGWNDARDRAQARKEADAK